MAQSVATENEPSAISGNGGGYGYNVSRSTSSPFSPLRQRPQLGPRARSASSSNLQDIPERAVRFRDDTLLDQRNREQDVLSELIDFLRNHAPPSDNFMSIPDKAENEDRGRWSMLRRLAPISKRKSILKPQNIRLPDSAVSGTTIGGHRHIAISIPLAASPFGQNPRSQYPIYHSRGFKPITSRYTPTRAYVNEKGIVTVLQGITEDRESPTATSPVEAPRYQLSSTFQQGEGDLNTNTYTPAAIPKSSTTSKIPDYTTLVRSLSQASARSDIQECETPKQVQKDTTVATPPNYRASLPARGSSLLGGRSLFPESSIDAVILQQDDNLDESAVPPDITRPTTRDSNGHSLSKSIITTGEEPIVSEAQQVRASKSSPVIVEDIPMMSPKKNESRPVTLITQSPLIPTDRRKSPTPSVKSTQSRREKVRAKKLKDLEAARNVIQRRQSEQSQTSDAQSAPTPPARSTLRPKSIRMDSYPVHEQEQEQRPQSPTMSSIMVVSDVHPSPPPVREQPHVKDTDGRPQTPPQSSRSGGGVSSKRDASNSTAGVNGSNNPTPPHSVDGSPPHRRPSLDRTSLSRRREWNASREKERKEREQLRKAQAIRAKARQLGINQEEPETSKLLPMEQDVLRRYEAYREYRIREMERRVRRLERNGDVWLRALVPVLDNLNRTLANVQQEQSSKGESPSQAQGWVSDDSTGGSQDARGRSLGYRRQQVARDKAARRGNSERQFLEQLVKKRDELAAGSNSDDMSGFDTIEPLMRELAGRSRLSFEARKTLGVDQDGGMISTY